MDTSDVCRLCGSTEEIKINIFEPGSQYRQFIHSLLSIWVNESDYLPKKLCYRCEFKLREFYEFREQCIRTDVVLKKMQANREFRSPTRSEEMCVEKKYEGINEQFKMRENMLKNDNLQRSELAAREEIIIINSRSPSPASNFDSAPQNAHMRSPRINGNKSTQEAENETKGQKCKRIKMGECTVLLQKIPDETANVNESSIVINNCYSLSVNKSTSNNGLFVGKLVSSENDLLRTDLAAETRLLTNLNVKPMAEAIHSGSNKTCKVEDMSNVTDIKSVQKTSEKNITSGKSFNSNIKNNLPKNIIVTKIPGLYDVYTCSYCERTFVTRESAVAHDCNVQPFFSDKLSYKCEICSKVFSRQAILLAHRKHHYDLSSGDDDS